MAINTGPLIFNEKEPSNLTLDGYFLSLESFPVLCDARQAKILRNSQNCQQFRPAMAKHHRRGTG